MADWDGLRRDLEDGVTPPPLTALRARRQRRQQRRTIALACTIGMVGTASGVAILGQAAQRENAGVPPLAARQSELNRVVNNDRLPPPRDYTEHVVTDVDFVSPTTGWAIGLRCVGEACDVATWRTDDGGRTWSAPSDVARAVPRASYHEEDATGGAVRSLRMVDERRGYAFNPGLYVTSDGGRTWRRETPATKVTSVSVVGESVWVTERGCPRDIDCDLVVRTGTVGGELRALRVPQTNGALAVVRRAGPTGGYLLAWDAPAAPHASLHVTADAGATWQRRTHPCPDATAASLSAGAGRPLWLVCTSPGGRSVFQSADAGTTWTHVGDPPADGEVTDLIAYSATNAYLTLQDPGRLLVTRDGGRTWRPADGTGKAFGYANLDVVDPAHAWAMGDAGQLWRTTDGTRWERLALPPGAPHATTTPKAAPATPAAPADKDVEFTGLSFTDARHGWALGRRCAKERCRLVLRRTSDGGETWQVANAPAAAFADVPNATGDARAVHFVDERNGFLYRHSLHVTNDGGATWRLLPGHVGEVAVRDGWVWTLEYDTCASSACYPHVGRARLGHDGFEFGFTGDESPIRSLATLAVRDADTAYLVPTETQGHDGVLMATDDGGRTWQRRAMPCPDADRRTGAVVPGQVWVLCGTDAPGDREAHRVAISRDGGRRWSEQVADVDGYLSHLVALSPSVAWRADFGPAEGVRVTRDGGRTWTTTPTPGPRTGDGALAFQLLDERTGFALFAGGVVARMTDGRTWERMTRP